ncbi:aspartate aminotransferase family protein [Paenibacillus timonensis]|uniref:alanine--glyoxylate transaminase n=1 Tax=Paenibacillus timonensis TaxID=225915 RepID=A0ABW3S9H4_9BACL|nr:MULTISPECIES: aspartate aminotransferase family protein [Paenibacillus]MCH1639578.1 aspartate aminotransferase family protein [Paenibacillus timonensis]MDU2241092.1 aspartate aminotransferase family protein [Paenibacillus sp.]
MQSYIGPEQVLKKREQYFYPCTSHFYRNPPQLVKGGMQYLFGHDGKRYTDFFAGVSVVASGHCNPEIAERTAEQLRTLQHTCTIYLTQPNVDLAERLAGVLPGGLRRTFFVNSGSEANEGALLLARMHTGRRGFLALEQGLHGRTYLTMSVTGLQMWRTDPQLAQDTDVTFIPRPYERGLSADEAARRSLAALEAALAEKGDTIAAMIAEPIQGNAGIVAPADWYFAEVKRLLEQHGVLLIADEIQTGFGRTGRMFAMDRYGVTPDILTMAKALGSGIPVAGFATTDEIAASLNRPSASTFGGNPVSSVTALAVLDYIEAHRLPERAERLGELLRGGLTRLAARFPQHVSEVRGAGLMLGAELCAEEPERGAKLTDDVLEAMLDRGYIIGKNGVNRNVLAFQPPLVIAEDDVRGMLDALEAVLAELA